MVMPGQFQMYVLFLWMVLILNLHSLQDQYTREFSVFKPDKVLRWLPHLGRVHLQLELDDRTLEADVPPLEAAFIELFSEKGKQSFVSYMRALTSCNRHVDSG